jgi:aminoglycoside 3-N-acetyltransferase
MNEIDVIAKTKKIITEYDLNVFFKQIGIAKTDVLCVHTSMSSIGFISGGPQAVVSALLDTVSEGTILMPAHSGDFSDPAQWENPPVPKEWFDTIYENMPAFDVEKSYLRGMGRVAEQFFSLKNTLRSNHPQTSFCAYGKQAHYYTKDHTLTPMFGLQTPLGKLYQHGGKILLLGVGFERCTALHVAEHLTGCLPKKKDGTPVFVNGKREWVWFEDDDTDNDDFPIIGEQLIQMGLAHVYPIGYGQAIVIDAKPALDASIEIIKKIRNYT